MQKLTIIISAFGLFYMACFISSCKTDVNINQHIDKNIPLKLTIIKKDSSSGFSTQEEFKIAVNSTKYRQLIDWGYTNVNGWTQTVASYTPDVFVGQGEFRLLTISKGIGVVVGFNDNNNKPRQYIKTIKKEDLDFLQK